MNLYIEYLTSLLSAQTHYLNSVLLTLTRRLWVGPVDCVEGGNVLENIHRAIRAVLEQTPLATSLLMPFISKNYPFKGKSVEIQVSSLPHHLSPPPSVSPLPPCIFSPPSSPSPHPSHPPPPSSPKPFLFLSQELALRNVLYMSMYCPTLREDILELVVHKMLTIDVSPRHMMTCSGTCVDMLCMCRQVELPSLEEEGEEEEGDETQFHVELDSSADDCVAIADSAASLLELTYSNKHVMKNEQAEKLDVMMATCMDHLHMICHHKGESDMLHVTCYMSHATCHMLHVRYATCHVLHVRYATCHVLHVRYATCHMLHVRCYMSDMLHVTCYMSDMSISHATCHMLHVT